MMKKYMALIPIIMLAMLLMAADDPVDTIRLTIINKSETDIAVQLIGRDHPCCNKADVKRGEFYYLPVQEGTREKPTIKAFDIEKNTYTMHLYYISTYDPVYGFKCDPTAPNPMMANNNMKVVVLPCNTIPRIAPSTVGERTMWKYLPFPIEAASVFFTDYWKDRLIY